MSKYILKRDLPFAKAGTKVDQIRSSKGTEELSFIQVGNCKCDLPDSEFIFDWIEEVKPREFELIFDACGDLERLLENGSDLPIDNRGSKNPNYKKIKVREVIE